ncbi:hypothetical protein BGZ81_003115 [Podila clonocystis]|nr:hypothetical protein BGZ81_003115 [Podila clonocystis]
MTAPIYGSTKFEPPSPPPYHNHNTEDASHSHSSFNNFTNTSNYSNGNSNSNHDRYFSELSPGPTDSFHSSHQQYSTAIAGSGIPALTPNGTRPLSQYHDPSAPVSKTRRPKSLAHDFETSPGTNHDQQGDGGVYQQYSLDTRSLNRKSLPAKSRQSTGAIIPQVPYSWVQSQYPEDHTVPRKASRQSFHELEQQQIQQNLYQEKQQQEDEFRQQYYQQQFLQQVQGQQTGDASDLGSTRPIQSSASPHHRGQSSGSDMPMSPNPPMTPSSMSNSEGSPMTALTSPLSSGRSSTGQYSQYHKAATQIPPSPAMNDHYRSKSYSSGPIPLTIPLESSPKESSPPSPYGSPSKPQSNRGSITPSRKARAKQKRESFYAAFQNSAAAASTTNNSSSGNNSNSSVNNEEAKPLKSQSRAASPHLPSGIPQLRTKSRSGVLSTPTADLKGRPTPPPRSRSRTPAGSAGTGVSAPVSQHPQVPQQYSGELQSILRKSVVIQDEPSAIPSTSPHRSPGSSTPNSKSGTPLPQTADTIPVPITDISKHLSGLELKDQARLTPASVVEPTPVTLRQQPSNSGSSHRRSIVFDIPKTPGRVNGSGIENHVGKMKDVGVMVSGAKERTSIFSSATQSTTRKRGKTLSAMDPPKAKPAPTILPPMYMSTTSRSTNIPAPMASRTAGSMIPSPSHGRVSSSASKDSLSKGSRVNTEELSANTSMTTPQNARVIRGSGSIAENLMQRSNASATIANDPPKPKTTRSFSSGLLSGLSRRKSAIVDPLTISTGNMPTSDGPPTPRNNSLSKASTAPISTRLQMNSQPLHPEMKKTPTSDLRTPSLKEPRNSPSALPKVPTSSNHAHPPGHPMDTPPTYTPSPVQTPVEPKSPRTASGVSPFPPLSPYAALKLYAPYLSLYERAEIGEYPQVYYVGQNCRHKKPASLEASHSNFGFDDERGDYLIVNHDHLMFRYEILDMLGKGSFGQVAKCYDHKTGEYVAIKIIRNKKRFHCQAVVEVKILSNLNKWDPEAKHNLIRMTDNFYFRNHLCIASELLSMNLYEFIKSNSFQGFSLGLIKRFCTQLLQSLELLSKHSVVHCDLKPENVLLKHATKSSIKVIDFGSSCLENEKVYTYIQSRFYRSPEVILGMSYNMAIDMWSLGCILAELYTGYPLFPGENEQEQLSCIMEIQGVPDRYLVDRSSRKKVFFDTVGNPKLVVNSKGKKRRPGSKTLAQALKCNDPLFLDFIARCLIWDPEKRMKPREGLQHEWISDIRAPSRSLFNPVPDNSVSSTSRRKSSIFSSQPAYVPRPLKVKTESDDNKMSNSSSSSIKLGRTSTNGNQSFSGNISQDSQNYGYGSGAGDTSFGSQSNKYGHYTGHYTTPSSSSVSSSVSSAASRRLTVGGDMGGSSYYGGSRKNTASMYVTGSSNTIGVATSSEYLRQATRDTTSYASGQPAGTRVPGPSLRLLQFEVKAITVRLPTALPESSLGASLSTSALDVFFKYLANAASFFLKQIHISTAKQKYSLQGIKVEIFPSTLVSMKSGLEALTLDADEKDHHRSSSGVNSKSNNQEGTNLRKTTDLTAINLSQWLLTNVLSQDFAVVKMNVKGTEYEVVPTWRRRACGQW